MNTAIQIFNNPNFGQVRTTLLNGIPMFAGVDIAKILGYENPQKAIRDHVDDEDRSACKLSDFQGVNELLPPHMKSANVVIINESGFYSLVLRSNKSEAKSIKKWVTSEVLPAIRRTGGYMVATPDETPEEIMARALLVANDTITRQKERADMAEKKALLLESQNARQAGMLEAVRTENKRMLPKVVFATAVETSDKSVLVAELATIIKQNGVEIGQNRLFEWLRKNGFLCTTGERYNLPTQRSLDMGLFEIKKTTITKPDGTTLVTTTPKVTGKGQIYFVNHFLYDSINQVEIEKQKKGGAL